jgi:hypothetical protein
MTDLPNSAHYRRYADVARKLAKQQGSNGFMWAQLAVLWNQVADRKAAREALRPPQDQTDNSAQPMKAALTPAISSSGWSRALVTKVEHRANSLPPLFRQRDRRWAS